MRASHRKVSPMRIAVKNFRSKSIRLMNARLRDRRGLKNQRYFRRNARRLFEQRLLCAVLSQHDASTARTLSFAASVCSRCTTLRTACFVATMARRVRACLHYPALQTVAPIERYRRERAKWRPGRKRPGWGAGYPRPALTDHTCGPPDIFASALKTRRRSGVPMTREA